MQYLSPTHRAVNGLASRWRRLQAFNKGDNLVVWQRQLGGGVECLCLEFDRETHCHEPHAGVGIRVVSEANQALVEAGCFKKIVQAANKVEENS